MKLKLDNAYENDDFKNSFIMDFFHDQTLQLSKPLTYKGLTLVGISNPKKDDGQRYLTLTEGIKSGDVIIKEVSEGGNVPKLLIQNKSQQSLFIMDGEELIGAKQNRIVNSSFIIKPLHTSEIPVSCVEQNRWSYNSRNFSASDNIIFNKGRKEKFQDIHERADYQTNQGRVWENIHEKMNNLNSHNATSSMNNVYKDKEKSLKDYVSRFQAQINDIGIIYGIGNKIEGVDIFHGNYLFKHFLPKIIKSCVLEILDKGIDRSRIPPLHFKKFFGDICQLPVEENQDYFGLGHEYRSKKADKLKANLISHNNLPVHLLGISVH